MNTMRQGAFKHAISERGHDLYETPICAVEALLRTKELDPWGLSVSKIWEPCAGRGAISRRLKEAGFEVLSTDIKLYDGRDKDIALHDFFKFSEAIPTCAAIVTNPPFKDADRFLRHAIFTIGLPTIVLLRLMAIEGAKRSDIMDHCTRIYSGIERLPFMHRDGWTGPRNSNSGAPFGWFVFNPETRKSDSIELRRISWRG